MFDIILKDIFQETLKPLGFKKKANNFYLQLSEIGQIVNLQKSPYGTKNNINFTINTAIFIPEMFLANFGSFMPDVPNFPTERVCEFRQRIGFLRGEQETWYDLNDETDFDPICNTMQENINEYILPHFARLASKKLIMAALDPMTLPHNELTRLMVYGEFKEFEKAKLEYELIVNSKRNFRTLNDAKQLAVKYGLLTS